MPESLSDRMFQDPGIVGSFHAWRLARVGKTFYPFLAVKLPAFRGCA